MANLEQLQCSTFSDARNVFVVFTGVTVFLQFLAYVSVTIGYMSEVSGLCGTKILQS